MGTANVYQLEKFTPTSLLLRGDESIIPRIRDVPVRMPFPPALRTGSIYESQTVLPGSAFEK